MRAVGVTLTVLALTFSPFAQAQPIIIADSGDSAWVLAASALILLLVPGLGLLYGSAGRSINVAPALCQGMIVTSIVSLIWAVVGYTLIYGEGSTWLGGLGNVGLMNLADIRDGTTISENVFVLFQMTFAVVTPVLALSSFADRVRLGWVVGFTALWSLLVYIPVARWVWGDGWLAELGTLDFAGGIVVHTTAGVAALVLFFVRGKHRRADEPAVSNNPSFTSVGVAMVLVGSFGLSGGSFLAAGADAASAIMNTLLAASAGGLLWLIVERSKNAPPPPIGFAVGAMAGLAAASSGAGYISPVGAIITGVLGSLAAFAVLSAFKPLRRINRSVHVFASHGIGGIVGGLTFPFFVLTEFGGPGYDEGVTLSGQFTAQSLGIVVTILWTALATAIAALMVAMVVTIRPSDAA